MVKEDYAHDSSRPRSEYFRTRQTDWFLEIEAAIPSEIKAIDPLVDRVTRLLEKFHCVPGEELHTDLAFREALKNAVVHGNRLDPAKLVEIRCRCDRDRGLLIVVKDEGEGFDPTAIPDPLAAENLVAPRGRGILLMRFWMDEVSFEAGGTEVHMRKRIHFRDGNRSPAKGRERSAGGSWKEEPSDDRESKRSVPQVRVPAR